MTLSGTEAKIMNCVAVVKGALVAASADESRR